MFSAQTLPCLRRLWNGATRAGTPANSGTDHENARANSRSTAGGQLLFDPASFEGDKLGQAAFRGHLDIALDQRARILNEFSLGRKPSSLSQSRGSNERSWQCHSNPAGRSCNGRVVLNAHQLDHESALAIEGGPHRRFAAQVASASWRWPSGAARWAYELHRAGLRIELILHQVSQVLSRPGRTGCPKHPGAICPPQLFAGGILKPSPTTTRQLLQTATVSLTLSRKAASAKEAPARG